MKEYIIQLEIYGKNKTFKAKALNETEAKQKVLNHICKHVNFLTVETQRKQPDIIDFLNGFRK